LTVEEQDVRDAMAGISTDRLSSATITKQIEFANVTIENEKSDESSDEVVEDAKLAMAVYFSLLAYGTKLERTVGGVPPAIERLTAIWERMHERFLEYAKRTSVVRTPAVTVTESLTEVIEEELP